LAGITALENFERIAGSLASQGRLAQSALVKSGTTTSW
jgi:hypothetical protein